MADLSRWTPPPPGPMTLEGGYARLVPPAPAHAAAIHAANATDPAIWTHLSYGPLAEPADYAVWVDRMSARPDPFFFAIRDLDRPDPGGVASIDPANGSIEVGHICLSRDLQRTRAASEAIFLLADWAFAAGYRRFEWKCDAANGPSRRAAMRFGFAFEGVFRRHMIVKGRNRDTAWFAIVDRDWPELRDAHRCWLDPANFDASGRQRLRLGDLTDPVRRRAGAEHSLP